MMVLSRTTPFLHRLAAGWETNRKTEVDKESTDKSREKRWSFRIG